VLVTGEAARGIGELPRSRLLVGEFGSGGRGTDGGGVGSAVPPADFRIEACELDLARAIAAASGESDSRLKFAAEEFDVID